MPIVDYLRRNAKEYGDDVYDIPKKINEVISNNVKVKEDKKITKKEKTKLIDELYEEMKEAARKMDFERAMELRDIIFEMKQ